MSCSLAQSADGFELRDQPEARPQQDDFRIRLLQEQDVGVEARFLETLSHGCRRHRFLGQISSSAGLLARGLSQFDFEPDTSFAAFANTGAGNEIAGLARYSLDEDGGKCECAVTLADRWANTDLGVRLMRRLIDLARARGIRSVYSIESASDTGMQDLARRLGFQTLSDPRDPQLSIHRLDLQSEALIGATP
jgi:acetyltransferase